jgi:ClpX C4-type zinc finger
MSEISSSAQITLYCSFCGKSQYEMRELIAEPTVFICDEFSRQVVEGTARPPYIYADRHVGASA